MLRALGAELFTSNGEPVGDGGGALTAMHRAELSHLRRPPARGALILSDVRSPLLGPTGAARMFGPQKGASMTDVEVLERGLETLAHCLGVDPTLPGAGAAGETGYALLAWGAQMASGAVAVADAIGLSRLIRTADLVITGEGRFDGQSEVGKVPTFVQRLAIEHGCATALVAGLIDADPTSFVAAVSLADLAGSPTASLHDPARFARAAGSILARAIASQ